MRFRLEAVLVAAALTLLGSSVLLPHLVDVPTLPPAYLRVQCEDVDGLRAQMRASDRPRRIAVVVVVPPDRWSACAHLASPALTGDGIRPSATSAILMEVTPDGESRGLRVCLGCDIVRPSSSERQLALALRHGVGPLTSAVALALLVIALLRWGSARALMPPTRAAPSRAQPGLAPAPVRYVQLTPLEEGEPQREGGPFVWLERDRLTSGRSAPPGPHVRLAEAGDAFRQGGSPWPRLVGPGSVSGLAVADGDEAPLASGDVVRIGAGPPLRLTLPGIDERPLRLRLGDNGYRIGGARSWTRRALPLAIASGLCATGALVAAAFVEPELQLATATGALVLVAATRAWGWRATSGELRIVDGELSHHVAGRPARALVDLRVARRGAGEAWIMARLSNGEDRTLERIRPPGGDGEEALALAEQWIVEAEQLASRRGASGPRDEPLYDS